MWIAKDLPLELGEIDGVVKQAFWKQISGLAEYQRQHPELYGLIEHELEWVDISKFKSQENCSSAEERWLNRVIRGLESSSNGIPAKTYVIPFRVSLPGEVVYYDGIPGDFYFVQVYGAEPYPMMSLRDKHVFAQYFYSVRLAELPSTRRERIRIELLCCIASTSDPYFSGVYRFLYPRKRS